VLGTVYCSEARARDVHLIVDVLGKTYFRAGLPLVKSSFVGS